MAFIRSFGAHVPRHRLARSAIVEANRWFAGGMGALAKGERAVANWDEDAVTMAVAAGRNALAGGETPAETWLASTTAPFADRQNAGIVAAALAVPEESATLDLGGSLRAGTSALLTAARAVEGERTILVTAAEQRRARAGSTLELASGDAGAAFLIGADHGVAEIVASRQMAVDFVDHYRAADRPYDYQWEDRWVRDEGFARIVPELVGELLAEQGLAPGDIDRFLLPAPTPALPGLVARRAGIPETAVADGLFERLGFAGAAHAGVMLADVLERAQPQETILVVGFGQGADAVLVRTTPAIAEHAPRDPVSAQLERGIVGENYMRFLALNDTVEQEHGIRAELDLQTAPTILYRNRHMLHGFYGGKCGACGAVQFPAERICVNPDCGALDSQAPLRFADMPARLQSYTADSLTYTPDPPARYGMVKFRDGGALMMDITDARAEEVAAGADMAMVFRIKSADGRRGITRYFWKATPASAG